MGQLPEPGPGHIPQREGVARAAGPADESAAARASLGALDGGGRRCAAYARRGHREARDGESVDGPRGTVHRIENPGKAEFVIIETQTGDYFGEDDIVRIENDYCRDG